MSDGRRPYPSLRHPLRPGPVGPTVGTPLLVPSRQKRSITIVPKIRTPNPHIIDQPLTIGQPIYTECVPGSDTGNVRPESSRTGSTEILSGRRTSFEKKGWKFPFCLYVWGVVDAPREPESSSSILTPQDPSRMWDKHKRTNQEW